MSQVMSAKLGGINEDFTVEPYENIHDAVEAYGEAPVYSLYRQKYIISARGVITSAYDKAIKDGKSHDEAVAESQAKVSKWKPGQAAPRSNKEDKAFNALIGLDDEAIKRLEAKQGLPEGALLQVRDQLREASGWEDEE